jgi:HEAT repeat protein
MSPSQPDHVQLLHELHASAAWEDLTGAVAAARRLAALPGDEAAAAMVAALARTDSVDLTDDPGDIGDEVYRTRAALREGLTQCGARVVPMLRPLLAGAASGAAQTALLVLAALGDGEAMATARRWLADEGEEGVSARLAAIEATGQLRPPDAADLLRQVLARPGNHPSWLYRITAHAFGHLGDLAALDALLDSPDWFARLGAAEALAQMPAGPGDAARDRARRDPDPRVARAAHGHGHGHGS